MCHGGGVPQGYGGAGGQRQAEPSNEEGGY